MARSGFVDEYGNDLYDRDERWQAGQFNADGSPLETAQPGNGPSPIGGMENEQMLALYREFLAQGMSEYDAIEAAKAANGGMLPVLNPGYEPHTSETHDLPWIPEETPQYIAPPPQEAPPPPAPPQQTYGGGGGYGGGGYGGGGGSAPISAPANNGGLFNPALYTPWTGEAPEYVPPTLPQAPSFDTYYDQTQYPVPVYEAPKMRQAPAFEPGRFKAPTLEEAENQPGYRFGVQEGERALQQSRAAQGLLRTGGTFKDILDYGRNAATQNYGNVFNQNLSEFKTNEGGRVDAYNTNYETQYKDPNDYDLLNANAAFQSQAQGNRLGLDVAQARFAPALLEYQTNAQNAQRQAELGYNADWQKYQDQENVFYNNQTGPFTKYLSLAQLGAANA